MLRSKLKKLVEGSTQRALGAAITMVFAAGEQAFAASGTSPFAGVEKLGNNTVTSLANLVSIGAVIGATVLVLVAIATKKWNSGWMWTILGGLVFIAALPQAIPWIQGFFTS
ncbi:MAG: hypothetical protein KAY22_02290 [Rhizorhabdus sp.]|uniref:hypothetical protein n=1 Tax=Rhizorhabdus sp. TaxID=1968843 RepID=UPI001B3F7916|nr:hypothetical protein [Rhizorhabdus sp.]MBP8231110.1 hypothetical protein [Rhizorhabdus sp.]